MSVGKKLNKKYLLSNNLATKHGYCTQRNGGIRRAGLETTNESNYDRTL